MKVKRKYCNDATDATPSAIGATTSSSDTYDHGIGTVVVLAIDVSVCFT